MTTDEEKGVSHMEEFLNTPRTFINNLQQGGGGEMWGSLRNFWMAIASVLRCKRRKNALKLQRLQKQVNIQWFDR